MKPISIKGHLIRSQLTLAFTVLVVCTLAFILNDLLNFRKSVERNLESMASVLEVSLVPALSFSDASAAAKVLSALKAEASITAAKVLDARGQVFASYGDRDELLTENVLLLKGVEQKAWLSGSHLLFNYRLSLNDETLGFLLIDADTKVFAAKYTGYLLIVVAVFMTGLLVSLGLAHFLQRTLSKPIVELARLAREITTSGNYFLRMKTAPSGTKIEEIQALSTEFNQMLAQIQTRDEQIRQTNAELERKVDEKTKALLVSSKMSALGEMSAGVAHEINNPLAIIHTMSDQLREFVREEPLDRNAVIEISETIEATVRRIATIVKGLRAISRDAALDQCQNASISKIIEDSLALCQEKFKNHGIQMTVQQDCGPLNAECRTVEISQVFLNLLNNAFDAIQSLPEKWIKLETLDAADQVEIRVTDSGPGIPPEVQKKLFQPFFTTKPIGKGTGLGLSISKGIIESHGGTFVLDNHCKNTRFIVRLPKKQPRTNPKPIQER